MLQQGSDNRCVFHIDKVLHVPLHIRESGWNVLIKQFREGLFQALWFWTSSDPCGDHESPLRQAVDTQVHEKQSQGGCIAITWCPPSVEIYTTPARETVAGVTWDKSLVSNNNFMQDFSGMRSLFASVSICDEETRQKVSGTRNSTHHSLPTLLSSIKLFMLSIQFASTSPSITIHLLFSFAMRPKSRMMLENNPCADTTEYK